MNLMGMGIWEVVAVLVVAFLVLGPSRSIDMARNVGKVLGDLRRSFGDVTSALSVETMDQRTAGRPQNQAIDLEPAPGVPIRPETASEDEDRSDGPISKPDDEG